MDWTMLIGDGNGIVAWGMAFLLASAGTAMVLAAWLQIRKSWRGMPRALHALSLRRRAAASTGPGRPRSAPAAATPATDRPTSAPRPAQGAVRAYADQAGPPTAQPAPGLTPEMLTGYLRRLHRAVDALESAADEAVARS